MYLIQALRDSFLGEGLELDPVGVLAPMSILGVALT